MLYTLKGSAYLTSTKSTGGAQSAIGQYSTLALASSASSPLETRSMSLRTRLMFKGNCPLSSGTLDFMSFSILENGILKKNTSPCRSWPRLPARPDI